MASLLCHKPLPQAQHAHGTGLRAACPVVHRRGHRQTHRTSALPEWMRGLLDFNSWAPKSTRIWRLQEYQYPENKADEVDELEAKINRLAASSRASSSSSDARAQETASSASSSLDLDAALPIAGSFSDADDNELASALSQRIQSIAVEEEEEEGEGSLEADEDVPPLSGQEMRQLIVNKYGRTYDCSFVRRDIPGKTFVCLNIMWQHLEQRSFRMTEEQYTEKIDSIAYMLNALGQTKKVRAVLQAPPRSEKGLPKRPVVGTAISIQLDLAPEVIRDFFSSGYY